MPVSFLRVETMEAIIQRPDWMLVGAACVTVRQKTCRKTGDSKRSIHRIALSEMWEAGRMYLCVLLEKYKLEK